LEPFNFDKKLIKTSVSSVFEKNRTKIAQSLKKLRKKGTASRQFFVLYLNANIFGGRRDINKL